MPVASGALDACVCELADDHITEGGLGHSIYLFTLLSLCRNYFSYYLLCLLYENWPVVNIFKY
uniref:Uncharacterized protein n=1 Tax=Cannabis sativa TaxID=3483 RepID=A0A803R9A9_CANSA